MRPASALAVVALGLAVTASAAPATGPRDVVQRLSDQVLPVLTDKSLSSDAKRERIETIVYASVDFATVSRLVLARNWNRFTPAQQARFQEEFKQHLSVTYGKNVDNYKNEDVVITGDREEARGDWTVKTKVRRGGTDDVLVDYRLRQSNGEWKVIDIVVEGVSLVANFRSQFQDLLGSNTPDGLIELIHQKNEKGESIVKDEPKSS